MNKITEKLWKGYKKEKHLVVSESSDQTDDRYQEHENSASDDSAITEKVSMTATDLAYPATPVKMQATI